MYDDDYYNDYFDEGTDEQLDKFAVEVQNGDGYYDSSGSYRPYSSGYRGFFDEY